MPAHEEHRIKLPRPAKETLQFLSVLPQRLLVLQEIDGYGVLGCGFNREGVEGGRPAEGRCDADAGVWGENGVRMGEFGLEGSL